MYTFYKRRIINRKTGEVTELDPVELTEEEFDQAAKPWHDILIKAILEDYSYNKKRLTPMTQGGDKIKNLKIKE